MRTRHNGIDGGVLLYALAIGQLVSLSCNAQQSASPKRHDDPSLVELRTNTLREVTPIVNELLSKSLDAGLRPIAGVILNVDGLRFAETPKGWSGDANRSDMLIRDSKGIRTVFSLSTYSGFSELAPLFNEFNLQQYLRIDHAFGKTGSDALRTIEWKNLKLSTAYIDTRYFCIDSRWFAVELAVISSDRSTMPLADFIRQVRAEYPAFESLSNEVWRVVSSAAPNEP